jgi:hypothetical protein
MPPTGLQQLCAFLILSSTCSLQVNRVFRITPRYFTDPERLNLTPKNCGSKKPGSFLFLVSATTPVLSGLPAVRLRCTVSLGSKGAHCTSPDTVFGNLPTTKVLCHLRNLESIPHFHGAWPTHHLPLGTMEVMATHLPAGSPWILQASWKIH